MMYLDSQLSFIPACYSSSSTFSIFREADVVCRQLGYVGADKAFSSGTLMYIG